MTEIDVAKLRSLAEAAKADWESRVPTMPLRRFHEATYPATVLALLDRLEQAELERDCVLAGIEESRLKENAYLNMQERAERAEAELNVVKSERENMGRMVDELRVREDEDAKVLTAVSALHSPNGGRCRACERVWPCPTVAALDTGKEKNE